MKVDQTIALTLNKQMWEAMQAELGDNPCPEERLAFKAQWVASMTNDEILHDCWLCEYVRQKYGVMCSMLHLCMCPVDWSSLGSPDAEDHGRCYAWYKGDVEFQDTTDDGAIYLYAPISEILALPTIERIDES